MSNSTYVLQLTAISYYSQILTRLLTGSGLFLIVVNIIGNSINMAVFLRKKFRSTSTGFYFTFLAIADLTQTYMIFQLYIQTYDIKMNMLSNFMCKFDNYLVATLPLFPAWTMVIIAFERFIVSTFASSANLLKSRKTQFLLVTLMSCVLVCLNVSLFKMLNLHQVDTISSNSSELVCISGTDDYIIAQNTNFNCILTTAFIPFLLMTTANGLTIRNMINSKKRAHNNSNFSNEKEVRFAITIISLNCMFFIFYIPMCITMITLMSEESLALVKDNHDLVSLVLIIMKYCRHCHSCLQFFIYMCVNKIYRVEFILLVVHIFPFMKCLLQLTKSATSNEKSKSTEEKKISSRGALYVARS